MKKFFKILAVFVAILGVAAIGGWYFTFGNTPALSAQCTGKNLLADMKREAPIISANMQAEADQTLYGKGLTWKIEKPGVAPSYLFGTIHMSDPRLLDFPAHVQKVLDESTTLALEVTEILEPEKLKAMASMVAKYTTYTDGTTLDDKLTEDQQNMIGNAVKAKMGLPWFVAKRMKPWVLMGTLSMPACELARKNAEKPVVDVKLGLIAKEQNKNIVGLETMESQLKAMNSLPENSSLTGLVQSVGMGERMDDLFETMIQLYLKEDTGVIWAMMKRIGEEGYVKPQENENYAEFQKKIVVKRNHTMSAESAKLIDKGAAFIAVGSLHLPGEEGMLNILAQQGYTISRVEG